MRHRRWCRRGGRAARFDEWPLLAGQLLAAGAGVSGLLFAVSPLVAVAAFSAAALLTTDRQRLPIEA